jgi:hypothetical protein
MGTVTDFGRLPRGPMVGTSVSATENRIPLDLTHILAWRAGCPYRRNHLRPHGGIGPPCACRRSGLHACRQRGVRGSYPRNHLRPCRRIGPPCACRSSNFLASCGIGERGAHLMAHGRVSPLGFSPGALTTICGKGKPAVRAAGSTKSMRSWSVSTRLNNCSRLRPHQIRVILMTRGCLARDGLWVIRTMDSLAPCCWAYGRDGLRFRGNGTERGVVIDARQRRGERAAYLRITNGRV